MLFLIPFSTAKKSYLSMNSAALSHKMKEDEEAGSFKLITNHNMPHESLVVVLSQNYLVLLSSPGAW